MIISLDERKQSLELVIFMEAETVQESAMLLRLASSMKDSNAGYMSFNESTVSGWIKVPLRSEIKTNIISGKW